MPAGDRGAKPVTGVCYYRKAMHLLAIADELLVDDRAVQAPEVIETTAKLLSLVADIKGDSPACWEHQGACPNCPDPDPDSDG